MKTKDEIYERYKKILEAFTQKSELSNQDIQGRLGNVTDKVLWQDIMALEKMGLIQRFRGGARSNIFAGKNTEFYRRLAENREGKEVIASKAIEIFLNKNKTDSKICIFLDSGSTNLILFKGIINDPSLKNVVFKIVSHNVTFAHECCPENILLILSGGIYSSQDECMVDRAVEIFPSYPARFAFLSASNLSYTGGLLGYNAGESKVKKAMIQNAEELVILADHSKFRFTGGELIAKFQWFTDGAKVLKLVSKEGNFSKPVKIVTDAHENKADILKGFIDLEKGITEGIVEEFILFAQKK